MVLILALAVFSSVLVVISQLLLKSGATVHGHKQFFKQYFNPAVIIAYFIFFLVTIINVFILSKVPLYFLNMMIGFSYVGVVVSSRIFIHERINRSQLIGICFITLGIFVFGLGS